MTEPRKFPGSWWWVLVLGLAVVLCEFAGVWLGARPEPPAARERPPGARAEGPGGPPGDGAGSPAAIIARYEVELTPALDERARTYAGSLGLDPQTIPSARAIFRSLAAGGSLQPPGERMRAPTAGAGPVCGDAGLGYACVSVAAHLDDLARWAPPPAAGP